MEIMYIQAGTCKNHGDSPEQWVWGWSVSRHFSGEKEFYRDPFAIFSVSFHHNLHQKPTERCPWTDLVKTIGILTGNFMERSGNLIRGTGRQNDDIAGEGTTVLYNLACKLTQSWKGGPGLICLGVFLSQPNNCA